MANNWKYLDKFGNYHAWKLITVDKDKGLIPVYQLTKLKTTPDNTSGYYNLDALLKLKNINVVTGL